MCFASRIYFLICRLRDHFGYGLSQFETPIQCIFVSPWLSSYLEWSVLLQYRRRLWLCFKSHLHWARWSCCRRELKSYFRKRKHQNCYRLFHGISMAYVRKKTEMTIKQHSPNSNRSLCICEYYLITTLITKLTQIIYEPWLINYWHDNFAAQIIFVNEIYDVETPGNYNQVVDNQAYLTNQN